MRFSPAQFGYRVSGIGCQEEAAATAVPSPYADCPVPNTRYPIPLFLLALSLLLSPWLVAQEGADESRLLESYRLLSAAPHHLAGSEHGRAAGDAIIGQLKAAGINDEQLIVQPFEVTQLRLRDGDCYFEAGGRRFPMQPLRPNGLALPVTPPEGIEAETVYLADGGWEHFRNREIRGRIAVLDEDCGERWLRAVRAGAAAVIFVAQSHADGPARSSAGEGPKWFRAHLEIPRFCVEAEGARESGLLDGGKARVFCKMGFERASGRNIFVMVPGSSPEEKAAEEIVCFACHYDSFGPLPFRSNTPSLAANTTAMVEAAAHFARAPLNRAVLVAFFDSNAQEQSGQLLFHFARDTYRGEDLPGSLTRMIKDREDEERMLKARLDACRDVPRVIGGEDATEAFESARQAILAEAEWRYDSAVGELSEARREKNLLSRRVEKARRALEHHQEAAAGLEPKAAEYRLNQLTRELARAESDRGQFTEAAENRFDAATAAKEAIYRVRKLLAAMKVPGDKTPAETHGLFGEIVSEVRDSWQARLREQERERQLLTVYRELGSRLSDKKLLCMVYWQMGLTSRRWTITGPGTEGITNLQVTRWMESLPARSAVAGSTGDEQRTPPETDPDVARPEAVAWSRFGGFVKGATGTTGDDVSTSATFVVELGRAGASGPAQLLSRPEADATGLAGRVAEGLDFCRRLGELPELSRVRVPARLTSVVFNTPQWTDSGRYDGCYVRHYDERTKTGRPIAEAVVLVQGRRVVRTPPPAAEWSGALCSSNLAGTFWLLTRKQKGLIMTAAVHDEQGRIAGISQRHPSGALAKVGEWESSRWYFEERNNQLVVFDISNRIFLSGIRSPVGLVDETGVKFLNGVSDTKAKEMNMTLSDDLLAVYTGRLRQYKAIQSSQILLNNSPLDPIGEGYEPEAGVADAVERSAADVWRLNEHRLDNLRRHNIMENALERLHSRSEALLDQASENSAEAPGLSWAQRLASLGYSDRVYGPVRTVTNDLVKAVVILLLLAIPFSFAVERAAIGTPNVYRQIIGFAAIFGIVFTILYLVHPAFSFATFPVVVLLAFTIIIMSSMVIAIMWGKFEYEVRKLHGVATASHQSSRSARGTILAAVAQGIATMRRRPLRTTLTGVTILLLTFTILFFGSFRAEEGVRKIFVGPGPSSRQIEVGAVPGKSFDRDTVAMLRLLSQGEAESYARRYSIAAGEQIQAGRLPDDSVFAAEGHATVPSHDLKLYPELKGALKGDLNGYARAGGIFLPPAIYGRIPESDRAGTVDFGGRQYALRGSFDPEKLKTIRTLDGASFVPPDVAEVRRQLELEYPRDAQAVELKLSEMELEDFPPVDPESIVLLWDADAGSHASYASSLVFIPQSDEEANRIAADVATLLHRRVSLSMGGEHFRVIYATRLALGGFSKVIVPLILGGMIIFGTMLSSVTDRQKEIYTFSALGLAPKHVAALFFAEAAVYAVVGGMGGYLFAHAFAKVVELMARQGWTEAPAMNHSSMNAMLTILIVMVTVMLSTIYPAFKASRSANPGIQRRWRMADPEGDVLAIEFPFTVSDYDMIGLVSFLQEYMDSHRDKSVGHFAADQVEVEHGEGRFTLRAMVWLQPFDQGVSQTFALRTEPSDIEGIDEVHVEMRRQSGSPAIWRRSSKVFINDLRNQFILWRTIPDDAAEHYHEMTAERFGLEEEESVMRDA